MHAVFNSEYMWKNNLGNDMVLFQGKRTADWIRHLFNQALGTAWVQNVGVFVCLTILLPSLCVGKIRHVVGLFPLEVNESLSRSVEVLKKSRC